MEKRNVFKVRHGAGINSVTRPLEEFELGFDTGNGGLYIGTQLRGNIVPTLIGADLEKSQGILSIDRGGTGIKINENSFSGVLIFDKITNNNNLIIQDVLPPSFGGTGLNKIEDNSFIYGTSRGLVSKSIVSKDDNDTVQANAGVPIFDAVEDENGTLIAGVPSIGIVSTKFGGTGKDLSKSSGLLYSLGKENSGFNVISNPTNEGQYILTKTTDEQPSWKIPSFATFDKSQINKAGFVKNAADGRSGGVLSVVTNVEISEVTGLEAKLNNLTNSINNIEIPTMTNYVQKDDLNNYVQNSILFEDNGIIISDGNNKKLKYVNPVSGYLKYQDGEYTFEVMNNEYTGEKGVYVDTINKKIGLSIEKKYDGWGIVWAIEGEDLMGNPTINYGSYGINNDKKQETSGSSPVFDSSSTIDGEKLWTENRAGTIRGQRLLTLTSNSNMSRSYTDFDDKGNQIGDTGYVYLKNGYIDLKAGTSGGVFDDIEIGKGLALNQRNDKTFLDFNVYSNTNAGTGVETSVDGKGWLWWGGENTYAYHFASKRPTIERRLLLTTDNEDLLLPVKGEAGFVFNKLPKKTNEANETVDDTEAIGEPVFVELDTSYSTNSGENWGEGGFLWMSNFDQTKTVNGTTTPIQNSGKIAVSGIKLLSSLSDPKYLLMTDTAQSLFRSDAKDDQTGFVKLTKGVVSIEQNVGSSINLVNGLGTIVSETTTEVNGVSTPTGEKKIDLRFYQSGNNASDDSKTGLVWWYGGNNQKYFSVWPFYKQTTTEKRFISYGGTPENFNIAQEGDTGLVYCTDGVISFKDVETFSSPGVIYADQNGNVSVIEGGTGITISNKSIDLYFAYTAGNSSNTNPETSGWLWWDGNIKGLSIWPKINPIDLSGISTNSLSATAKMVVASTSGFSLQPIPSGGGGGGITSIESSNSSQLKVTNSNGVVTLSPNFKDTNTTYSVANNGGLLLNNTQFSLNMGSVVASTGNSQGEFFTNSDKNSQWSLLWRDNSTGQIVPYRILQKNRASSNGYLLMISPDGYIFADKTPN